jgi:hypothetical protein
MTVEHVEIIDERNQKIGVREENWNRKLCLAHVRRCESLNPPRKAD